MNWTKQTATFAVAGAVGLGTIGLGTISAGPALAQPSPYTPQPRINVSTANPPVGGTIRITVKRFGANERVVVRIKGKPKAKTLARLDTNRKGKARAWVKLPEEYRCGHTLVARGKESGLKASTFIVIGRARNC